MGRRGPLPAPSNVRMLRGNPGGHQPAHTVSERTPPARPDAPEWLSEEARAEWDRVVPELDGLGILARVDRGVLALYCDTWGKFVAVSREIDGTDATVKPRNRGEGSVRHPLWTTYRALGGQLQSLASKLGCEPSARARLAIPAIDGDDLDGILD